MNAVIVFSVGVQTSAEIEELSIRTPRPVRMVIRLNTVNTGRNHSYSNVIQVSIADDRE